MALSPASVPVLWRLARLDYDAVREQHVLLYPEGAILLNDTATAIVELCDGQRTIHAIAEVLGQRYQRDVMSDIMDGLSQLAEGGFIRDAQSADDSAC